MHTSLLFPPLSTSHTQQHIVPVFSFLIVNKVPPPPFFLQCNNNEIRPGKHIGVCISVANNRLFVGSIPKSKTKEQIIEEFSKVTGELAAALIVWRSQSIDLALLWNVTESVCVQMMTSLLCWSDQFHHDSLPLRSDRTLNAPSRWLEIIL